MAWLVLGCGISGMGAAHLLKNKGESVYLFNDTAYSQEQTKFFSQLQLEQRMYSSQTSFSFEELNISHMVVSPGVGETHPLRLKANDLGVEEVSEIDLALSHYQGDIIAVTGTNGKSTTVSMISHILSKAGIEHNLAGNIGCAPSMLIAKGLAKKTFVLELSSYQLQASKKINANVALFLNFSPDHLARHKTLENYFKAKWSLFARQEVCHTAIMPKSIYEKAISYGLTPPKSQIVLIEESEAYKKCFHSDTDKQIHYSQINASFALAACSSYLKKSDSQLQSYLKDFQNLRHRFETVDSNQGIRIINDSKATNVDSVIFALNTLGQQCTLFLGGLGKGESFSPILNFKQQIKSVIAFGAAAKTIEANLSKQIPVTCYPSLKCAMEKESSLIRQTPTNILFSPGCASFDEFKNFEERGDYFCQMVKSKLR